MGKVELTSGGRVVKHGSASSYNNHKCRCQECTDAWAKYMKPRMRKVRLDKKKKRPGVQVNI